MNELFFLVFLSFFVLNYTFESIFFIDIFKNIDVEIELIYTDMLFYSLLFAVPKKRSKKPTMLKKNLFNKRPNLRRTNVKSIHFDEFFNNMQKWEIN